MMGKTAIEVKDLCIDYRPYKTLSIQKSLFHKKENVELVHAISELSFTVEKGSILGVIGKNGSGKSTLLKAIGGIFRPDKGTIDLKGQSVSLLSIGVGFIPENTGRENIILSGLLLGFTEKQIAEKMDYIIDFSELGSFIDLPVRTYSSGMYSKLAFAITASLETDIMLVDEVLSVGDERFQKKSYAKMQELISDRDRTVMIVSHSMNSLKELCGKVLWINDGTYMGIGEPEEMIEAYRTYMRR